MITKICLLYVMHPFFFSLLFLWLKATTAISLGHQLAAVGGGDADGVVCKCINTEKHLLLDFKAHLEDPDGILITWGIEDDCCRWSGVTCNHQTGHVTKLELSNKFGERYLWGEINPSLLNLSYLNHLDLSANILSGTIPESIGFLTDLRYLDLSRNFFNGTILKSISFLSELRYLDLSLNDFNETIPESIGSLTELRYLDLSFNSLYGTIPPEIGNLKNLRNLSLGFQKRCQVEDLDWLSHLSYLQSLQMDMISLAKANHWVNVVLSLQNLSFLSLWGCNLSEVRYPYSSFVNSSSSIGSLSLSENNLNSSMYSWLFPLTSSRLHTLDLSHNMLDEIPKSLGNLCGLESLNLDTNHISVKFPDFLNNFFGCTSITLKELYVGENQLTGSLSDEIQKFPSLEILDLSSNHLNGTISDKVWELPTRMIDVSNNSLEVIPSKAHVSNHVEYLDLSFCKLGPRFPKWIQTHQNLIHLSIANTKISDTIPVEFWNIWPSQLRYLNLSFNNISGEVSDLSSNFDNHSSIDLSSNNLQGQIPNVSSTLVSLNLSRNKFYGGISFVCQLVGGFLEFLDLSHNSLTGQLPDCLWHFKELEVLNLGHNNLSRRLPSSIGYLVQLRILDLYNNGFSGELPLALKKCTELRFLDLGANKFFGNVPIWIGENLTRLHALSLRSNNFLGLIPLQLCHLMHLQILDLSRNNLNGTIPSCVNNLNAMVQGSIVYQWNKYQYFTPNSTNDLEYVSNMYTSYVSGAIIEWQGNEREFASNLGLLTIINLSSNKLTGQIPNELTDLHGLLALNLSKNALLGEIPEKIGEMTKLLTLDLSRNNISGRMPSSMSQMSSLNDLDLSYNNLSGRIPSSTQLQSFEPSRYTGNRGLCGPPIAKNCPIDGDLESRLSDEEGIDELQIWFYIGGGIGFIIGFWIACSALLLNHSGRHGFFYNFLESFKDWVYVKMVVIIGKLQRAAQA